ncbi:MAG: hypothetical protein IKJ50_05695, partial [Clostridia bacterium]|nr:hypothetical protein [Clostridia bacterium]
NVNTECNYYPTSSKYAVVNNADSEQVTDFYDVNGNKQTITLKPMEIKWIEA